MLGLAMKRRPPNAAAENKVKKSTTNDNGDKDECGRIEVLVQGLDGICIDKGENNSSERLSFPWVTATVAFSGSAPNMEVCSSSVCGVTGQLLVESEPVLIKTPQLLSTSAQASSPRLSATWDWTSLPHLTMPFTSNNKEVPKKSLEKGNRGAKFVKRDLELSQTQSTVTETTSSTSEHHNDDDGSSDDLDAEDDCRSRSAVWSDSGATMPEIIEMYIRLRHDDDMSETLWDGVAFLIIYGHEKDRGTHVLELPIQNASFDRHDLSPRPNSPGSTTSSARKPARMRLSSDARLTVQVKVVSCRPTPPTPVASSIIAAGPPTCEEAALSQSAMDAELGPVLVKLQQSERLAQALRKNQKRAMDVDVPSRAKQSPLPKPPPVPETGPFCHVPGLGTFASLLTRIASMAVHCDTIIHRNGNDSQYGDENSTIATRESLGL